tara:strand:+ start:12 stop:2786 length:2775 start_codon:yes stop_codon:yes gene_type:complete
MEEIEVTFEGRKRTVKVPDNFDKTNPNHQEQLKQHFWKQDSKNKSGPLAEFLDVALEGVRAGTLDPAGSAFNIAEEERIAGQRAMKDAMSKFKAGQMSSAAFNALTGSMRWLFSPATGFGRAFAGDPVEAGTGMALEAAGVDPEIGVRDIPVVGESLADWGGDYQLKQFLGDTSALGTEMVQPGSVVKQLRDVPEHIRNYKTAKEDAAARETYDGFVDNVVEEGGEAAEVLPDADGAFVPRASVPLTRDVVTNPTFLQRVNAIRDAAGSDKQRLYKDVGDVMYEAIRSGEVPLSSISRLTKDLNMEPDEFVKAWTTSIREAGQSLNVLSQAAKQMSRDPSLPDGMRRQLDELAQQIAKDKSITMPEKFFNVLRSVENFRRGMMVSQLKTAVRNAGSAVGRITMASFDDAAQSILGGGSMKDMWNSIRSDMSALPGIRNKELLDQVLEGNPLTKDQLLYTSVNEATLLNKVSRAVNTMNVFQERAFRKYAFQAKLEKLARDSGVKLENMNPERIPNEWLETATKHALDMTFASSGGKMARKAVKMYDDFPILYTISNPFPRFVFGNSIPFLIEHSPYGLMKALSPNVVNDLAKGNSKEFAKAASRGLMGSTMLAWAMDLRDKAGGEKWYELAVENEDGTTTNIDTRPYAPMSLYLFMAQVIDDAKNPDRPSTLTPGDFTDVALGLNRVGGTGLILSDILRSGDVKSVGDIMAKFGGDWLGSFTTPVAQAKDVAQAISGDTVVRDTRGDTVAEKLLNPTLRNIPSIPSLGLEGEAMLPPRRSPLRPGVIEQQPIGPLPGGIASQVTGANLQTKTPVQREVDRLAINYSIWNPRTGNKEMDRRQTAIMGEYAPQIESFIMSDMYQNMDDARKKVALEEVLKRFKSMALDRLKGAMAQDDPELLRQYMIEQKTTKSQEGLLQQMGVIP